MKKKIWRGKGRKVLGNGCRIEEEWEKVELKRGNDDKDGDEREKEDEFLKMMKRKNKRDMKEKRERVKEWEF